MYRYLVHRIHPPQTQGVDLHSKKVKVPDTATSVELFLFDCSGVQYYRELVHRLVRVSCMLYIKYIHAYNTYMYAVLHPTGILCTSWLVFFLTEYR